MSAQLPPTSRIVYLGQRATIAGFTRRDTLELERWAGQGRRSECCHGDNGAYAMLYEGAKPWASWGVMRQGEHVVVWDCVTFADIGRFSSMHGALAAIPGDVDRPWMPLANVIAFVPVERHPWMSP